MQAEQGTEPHNGEVLVAMTLRDRLEREGSVLFKWRSYTPLLPLVAVLIWLVGNARSHDRGLTWGLVCLGIGLLGVAVRVVTVGYAPKGSSGRTTDVPRASVLNTSGPYSVVRHPLYLGNFLMWLSVGCFAGVWPLAVICALLFLLQYERIALVEESVLRQHFGESFEKWALRTPAFVPNPLLWRRPVTSFSWSTAIGRERSGLLGLTASFALLDMVKLASATGRVALSGPWLTMLGVTAAFYIVLAVQRSVTRLRRQPVRAR